MKDKPDQETTNERIHKPDRVGQPDPRSTVDVSSDFEQAKDALRTALNGGTTEDQVDAILALIEASLVDGR